MTKKILITAPAYFDEAAVTLFRQLGEVTVREMSREELLRQVADFTVLAIRVDTFIDKELIDAARNLKVIATGTTGVNHIDVEYAKKKGIEVISLQGANTIATTEHTLALLLSLVRKIPTAHASIMDGKWQRSAFIGTELSGKKLGIVGFGRIGRDIAKVALHLGMRILAYDPYLPESVFTDCQATRITSMDTIFAEADVITLHVLLTDETRNLVNKQRLALMKPTSVLINCSRGEIVSESDLLQALDEKKIAGAALDVFVTEPLFADNPLIRYAQENHNLILTPHIAGSTKESIREAGLYLAVKIEEFFTGETI
ncbi:MAG: hydroxyacid dehydrogenase [Nanoarchaeota archaeon]|nr:hydroxyacid dehydrogenase [Nanoarchaeota archaeon]